MNSDHMHGYQFCRDMYVYLRKNGMSPKYISDFVGKSHHSLRRYMSEPGTKSAQKPPVEVTDRLVKLIDLTVSNRRTCTIDEARALFAWQKVAEDKIVPRQTLANIAGLSVYSVAWVGRGHPVWGIVPTEDQVRRAMAAEALSQNARAA